MDQPTTLGSAALRLVIGSLIGLLIATGADERAVAAPSAAIPARQVADEPLEPTSPAAITDYYAEWQAAVDQTNADVREARLTAIAASWALDDPGATVTALLKLEDADFQWRLWSSIAPALMRSDPGGTIDLLRSRRPSRQRDHALAAALRSLAVRDPELALSLAETLDERARLDALMGIVASWIRVEPDAALAWFGQADRTFRQTALPIVAQSYAEQDIERALVWLLGQSDLDPIRAAQGLLLQLAKRDPRYTAELIDTRANPATRDAASRIIAMEWVHKDPQAVWLWSESFDDGPAKEFIVHQVFRHWALFDVNSALAHLTGLEIGPEYDAAAVITLRGLRRDPERAEALYATISTPRYRSVGARELVRLFKQTDPVRAERYRRLASRAGSRTPPTSKLHRKD